MTLHDVLRKRLLEQAGLWPPPRPVALAEARGQWCVEFEARCRSRLAMGLYRGYPRMSTSDDPRATQYLDRAEAEIAAYRSDGNLERLVDASNMMHAEYARGQHPHRHWGVTDDGEHLQFRA